MDEQKQDPDPFIDSAPIFEGRTTEIDEVLNEKLEAVFHKPTSFVLLHDVAKIASEHDPIDLAYAVSRLPHYARYVVYENLPDLQAKIIFMINTGRITRSVIFRQIGNEEIQQLVEKMPPDEAVEILDDLPDRRLKKILEALEPKKASRIRELQSHERHSAGRLMDDEFFAFHMNASLGEVAKYIRDHPGIDLGNGVFVVTNSGELIGIVPERNLIVNPPDVPLKQVMRPVLHSVTPDSSRDEVVSLVERYEIPTVPVVDEENHLLGVIAYQEVLETMEDIADETIASIAGTAEEVGEYEPIFKRFLWRAPWLLVTLCAGLLTSTVMTHFGGRAWFMFLPFFVPLIAGMSGNVGLQCSTILVRGMATGELSRLSRREAIAKEIMIGVTIASVFGLLSGFLIYGLNQYGIHRAGASPFELGLIVGCGLFSACLTATVLGSVSPFLFARLGIDPAVASGPIVTAFNDVSATLTFFLVAWAIHSLFLL